MPSAESRRIRAGFVRDPGPSGKPIEDERREWEESVAGVSLPAGVVVEPVTANGIACEWVRASGSVEDAALLFFHGGGYTSGSPRTHREIAARLSASTGLPVLLPDYRLAPEHPFPAAVEDGVAITRWLAAQGFRPDRIILGGDSAGGGLVAATLIALRDAGERMPAAAVLLSAWLDLSQSGESHTSRDAVDPLTSRVGLQHAADLYLNGHDPRDPLASPVFADLHGLPPLLIHAGDHEILLSDSVTLAERAAAAGVDVQLEVWPEMWHVFHAHADLPEAAQAIGQIGVYVRQRLGL